MPILDHFDKTKHNGFTIYRLKDDEWNDFLKKLPNDFRSCYISNHELKHCSSKAGITPAEFLKKYILPDEPIIKSGDFGEILSYLVVTENFQKTGFVLFGPKKWRWKDRNKAAQYTDSILFHIANPKKFSDKDLLVTIESKMKATKSKEHRIQDAIDGATDDKLTRMAKTLIWLEEKYARLGSTKNRIIAERFKDPATYGDFVKKYKAIAILDKVFEADELKEVINNPHGVSVIVFSLKELKNTYEQTRINVIKSV